MVQLSVQAGGVLSLEGSQDGRMAFSGGLDGRVLAHDLRSALDTVSSYAVPKIIMFSSWFRMP